MNRIMILIEHGPLRRYNAGMSTATFKIGKKEFVVLPRRLYDQLTRIERDAKDAEIARKGQEAYRAGKMKTISLKDARKKWGV